MTNDIPIQKIILFIEESAGQMPLELVLEYAKSLLQEDKQMVVRAFNHACTELEYTGEEYYNNNYTPPL